LKRTFVERGPEFFEKVDEQTLDGSIKIDTPDFLEETASDDHPPDEKDDGTERIMTAEELFKMRTDILPQLQ